MSVDALGGNSIDHDDCTVNISYEDLSIAAITYASGGHATTPKERIEILGRERSIVIEDFKSVTLDGKALAPRRQDKGHKEQAAAFMRAIRDGHPVAVGLESSRTTLLAAESAQAQFSSARLDRDH
jgi:predicted dehydrogenase